MSSDNHHLVPVPDPNFPARPPSAFMLDPMDAGQPVEGEFQLQKFLAFLLRFWWVPVLTLVLGAGGSIAYIRLKEPTFVSRASMWETVQMRLSEGATFSEDIQNYLGTQSELLQSGKMRELALARLMAVSTNALPRDKDGQPLDVKLTVLPSQKSSVFVVQAVSANPAYSQMYLDALLSEFLQYKRDVRKLVIGETLASISEQVKTMESELKDQQDALTLFERTNNLAILEEEGKVAGSYLEKLDTELSDYQQEKQILEGSILDQNGNLPSVNLVTGSAPADFSTNGGAVSSEPQTAAGEIELLKMERDRLSKYLRPKHPKIVKLDADIARDQALINIYRRQNQEQLTNTKQVLDLKIADTGASIKEWQVKVVNADNLIAEAEHLKQDVARTQTVYDQLKGLLQNVDISRNIDQDSMAILESASPARRSYKAEIMAGAAGILGGLSVGFGIVFLIAWRDDRFASSSDLTGKFGSVLVGQVPEMSRLRAKGPLPLLTDDDDRHMFAESYRNLRSALFFFATNGERPRLILITSAVPDEGKSTIAANLARILALGGSRVVLVDGDMRRGGLHKQLGLRGETGLTELLRNPGELDNIIQTNSLPNFFFISRGGDVNNPGDLLLGPALDRVLAQLRQRFDYVLMDSSPVFASDDATTLAPKLDGTLFVVRSRFSRAGAVQEALELLGQRQARVLGLVFNRADATAHSHYYYKYSDYYRPAKTA